jgi:predicted protein tyrosine phosphatase
MPIIQNVSRVDVAQGNHIPVTDAVLIQIVDPAMSFPAPPSWVSFKEIHQFEFLDIEDDETRFPEECKISDSQAESIVEILRTALVGGNDVIVHCTAGLCRSGAVAEVGVMMGFDETGRRRQPNVLVKGRMIKALGWSYN